MARARIQGGAVVGRAFTTALGVRARGFRGAVRMVVLASGAAPPRVQPQGCLPRAHTGRAEEAVVAEFSEPRQGLRRLDAAAADEGRGDAPAPSCGCRCLPLPGDS